MHCIDIQPIKVLHFCNVNHEIGNKIKEVLEGKGISVTEFAKRISTSRNNVYGIFERQSIDTELLYKISEVLQFDFFKYYNLDNAAIPDEKQIAEYDKEKQKLIEERKRLERIIDVMSDNLETNKKYIAELEKALKEKVKV